MYSVMPFQWWLNLLLADVAATVFVYLCSAVFRNASIYDPYWSVQPLVILGAFAVGSPLTVERALLLAAVFLWGIRLTVNWAYTFQSLAVQDWRYTMLHEKTGWLYPVVNFLGIHMVPTLVVYLCTLPAAYAFVYDGEWNFGTIVCAAVSFGAVLLQGIADCQMHRYRKHRDGPFIRTGLWMYSRHPNYLGEILMWWGIAGAVWFLFPQQWGLMAGAVANTLLFLVVSIPMADRRQSGKTGFAAYKQQTRMLLPIRK